MFAFSKSEMENSAYSVFISSKDRISGASTSVNSASYTVQINTDRLQQDPADFFEVSLVSFFASNYNATITNQISAENTNFYQIQLSMAQPKKYLQRFHYV